MRAYTRKHGYITGPLTIIDDHGSYDLRERTWWGPVGESKGGIVVREHDASFVLLVEKQNVFERLLKDQFHLANKCVVASGNGYPGRAFWSTLRKIHDRLRIPFYVITDHDPAGYLLFFLICRGAARRDRRPREELAIPDAAHLGLRACDHARLGMDQSVQILLSDSDRQQLDWLRTCTWLRSDATWQRELDQMMRNGFKLELEALCSLSMSYLARTYLPERLRSAEWLRLLPPAGCQ
jgi:DNA topoisomerase VI subunit A